MLRPLGSSWSRHGDGMEGGTQDGTPSDTYSSYSSTTSSVSDIVSALPPEGEKCQHEWKGKPTFLKGLPAPKGRGIKEPGVTLIPSLSTYDLYDLSSPLQRGQHSPTSQQGGQPIPIPFPATKQTCCPDLYFPVCNPKQCWQFFHLSHPQKHSGSSALTSPTRPH